MSGKDSINSKSSNKNSYMYKIVIFILFVANILLLIKIKYKNNKDNIVYVETIDRSVEVSLNNLTNSFSKSIMLEGKKIKGNPIILNSIKNVVSTTPKLVLRFSEFSCESCVDKALYELKRVKSSCEEVDIIIITSFENLNGFKVFKNKFKENYNFINEFEDVTIEGELKNIIIPHFFILDRDLKISSLYIYQEEILNLNKNYFNEIVIKLKSY